MAENLEKNNRERRVLGSESVDSEKSFENNWQRPLHVDVGIVIVSVIMLAFGLVMLFSASMSYSLIESNTGTSYLIRQMLATSLGFFFMIALSKFSMKIFDHPIFATFVYMFSLILLVLTLFSAPQNGARRWLTIPVFGTFQPSEFTKVVIVYTIAVYQSWLIKQRAQGKFEREAGIRGAIKDAFLDILLPLLLVAMPVAIMSLQTHMSGIMIILLISFASLLAAGIPTRSWLTASFILIIIVAALALILVSIWSSLPESITGRFGHVFTRLEIFSDSETVSPDKVYQINQGLISLGSGGWFGVGLGRGKQKHKYLPEVHNDYIFSSIVEELGFVGGMFVLGLFIIFLILGYRVAYRSSSVYAQIVATGISSLVTLQAVLNVAVNVIAIPPTGISLPFFSYGGTSNLFFLIGVGLLLNVSKFGVRDAT